VAVDPQFPSMVYSGGYYYDGSYYPALFKSTDSGLTWSDVSSGLSGYLSNFVYDVEVDPNNSSIVYAGASKGLFKSTDGGASWHKKGSLYNVYSVTVSPSQSRRVYTGCYEGVYYSPDEGETWYNSSQGLRCQYVTSLRFHPSDSDTLYAGTYGGSLYKADEESGVEEEQMVAIPEGISLFQNYPNPFNLSTIIPFTVHGKRITENGPFHTTLTVYNILGQKVKTLTDEPKKPGTYEVQWDGKDSYGQEVASGVYFYRIQAKDFVQTKRMLLIK